MVKRHVVIVTSSPLTALGIRDRISGVDGIDSGVVHVVEPCDDGLRGIVRACGERAASILILDSASLKGDCEEFVAQLARRQPETRVAVVVPSGGVTRASEYFRAGARAVVSEDSDRDEFTYILGEVVAGHVAASRTVLRGIVGDPSWQREGTRAHPQRPALTTRELAIVELLARGLSNREIGEELHLAEATVKVYLGQVMSKWQVRDRLQVVLNFLGRLEPESSRSRA